MPATATKTRRKRCSECNELKDDVIGKQRLCSDCEQNMDYCTVCGEWQHAEGDQCRHIQWWNAGGLMAGCGSDHIDAEGHLESFRELLKRFAKLRTFLHDEPLLPAMLPLIEANNFWTTWHGPLIGEAPALELKYEKDFQTHKSVLCLRDIYASTQEKWGWKNIEAMQLGMSWLTSLDDTTKEANKITAGWIREFLAVA